MKGKYNPTHPSAAPPTQEINMIQHRVPYEALREMGDVALQGAKLVTPHWAFIDTLRDECRKQGWRTEEPRIDTTENMAACVFACRVSKHDVRLPPEATLFVGGCNSLMKYRTSRLYCGMTYRLGSTAVFDMSLPMKGTLRYPLPDKAAAWVEEVQYNAPTYFDRVRHMREMRLSRADYNHFLFEAANIGMIHSKRLATLARNYDSGETAWTAYLKMGDAYGNKQVLTNPQKDKLGLHYEMYTLLYKAGVPA